MRRFPLPDRRRFDPPSNATCAIYCQSQLIHYCATRVMRCQGSNIYDLHLKCWCLLVQVPTTSPTRPPTQVRPLIGCHLCHTLSRSSYVICVMRCPGSNIYDLHLKCWCLLVQVPTTSPTRPPTQVRPLIGCHLCHTLSRSSYVICVMRCPGSNF
jgi:hypothetical protein